ncbi:MAG: hypothetical protein EP335_09345 [Alphaproteobacteria bacterium]|nr:MAG: hypothetical protein EP335_09345 [Alphaproteobacteria bacterium]
MTRAAAAFLVICMVVLWYVQRVPDKPARVVEVTVLALEDAPDGIGARHITVRFPDGTERVIETLAPFFYKPGYIARVGIFERPLFEDVYDFVADPAIG